MQLLKHAILSLLLTQNVDSKQLKGYSKHKAQNYDVVFDFSFFMIYGEREKEKFQLYSKCYEVTFTAGLNVKKV